MLVRILYLAAIPYSCGAWDIKLFLVAAWKGMSRGPYHEGDVIEEVHWVLL
jgi:hypothetical protein